MGHELNTNWGRVGEDKAEVYLESKGYKILTRNFRVKTGEIDIIAKDKSYLVFVEVKLKKSSFFGLPEEMVHSIKQFKVLKTAQLYIQKNNIDPETTNWRFDVVSVMIGHDGQSSINHIIDAINY